MLRAKADLVDKLISEIPDAIRAMSDDSYLGIMRQMLLESSPVGEVDVVVAANDRKRITGAFLQDVEAELRKQGKDVSLKPAGTANSIRGGFLRRPVTSRWTVPSTRWWRYARTSSPRWWRRRCSAGGKGVGL